MNSLTVKFVCVQLGGEKGFRTEELLDFPQNVVTCQSLIILCQCFNQCSYKLFVVLRYADKDGKQNTRDG